MYGFYLMVNMVLSSGVLVSFVVGCYDGFIIWLLFGNVLMNSRLSMIMSSFSICIRVFWWLIMSWVSDEKVVNIMMNMVVNFSMNSVALVVICLWCCCLRVMLFRFVM